MTAPCRSLQREHTRVDERSESTKARIEAREAGWWMTAPIGRRRSPSDRRAAPHPPFYEVPVVNPRASFGVVSANLNHRSVLSTLLSTGEVPLDCTKPVGKRVDNTDSFCSAAMLSACAVLSAWCQVAAGTCRASSTFYPCRHAAGHHLSYAPYGADDTSRERAPSTKSVRLSTRVDDGRARTLETAWAHVNSAVGCLPRSRDAQATFSRVPSGTRPLSANRHKSITRRRARATMPMRRWRLPPCPKRSWNQRLCLLCGW